jgi:hypothetical protein
MIVAICREAVNKWKTGLNEKTVTAQEVKATNP